MNRMKIVLAGLVASVAIAPAFASAASIGLNFSDNNAFPNFTLDTSEAASLPADYFATDGYINSGDLPAGGSDYAEGALGASGIYVMYTSSNTFFAGAETSPAQQLHRSYIDDGDTGNTGDVDFQPFQHAGDGVGVSGRITGLANYVSANNAVGYIIRFYFTTDDNAGTFEDVKVLNGSQVTNTDGSDLFTATVLSTVAGTVLGGGNYPDATDGSGKRGFADSSLLTADDIVFTIASRIDNNDHQRGTIAGFRITTVVPAPAALPAGLGLLALLSLRRRR